MTSDEMLFQLRQLRDQIVEARLQLQRCNHNHHCHIGKHYLITAESIACELAREVEIQQGEQLLRTAPAVKA